MGDGLKRTGYPWMAGLRDESLGSKLIWNIKLVACLLLVMFLLDLALTGRSAPPIPQDIAELEREQAQWREDAARIDWRH